MWFWLAVFCTFAMLGFVLDILARGRQPALLLALNVMSSGLLAVGYALASLPPRPLGYVAMLIAHALYVALAPRAFTLLPVAPQGRVAFDVLGTILTVTVGYTSFLRFINVTAARYLRAQAEIALARDIHRVLVPRIQQTIGEYDFFGWSLPSGDVGGDLVDLVETGGRWLGYVADVSGHGVGPGVVMGMFKSALRMRALGGGSVGALLGDVHRVLMPLKQPQTFVTVACVRGGPDGQIECAVAGHLPILRIRNGVIEEVTSPQPAIGMLDDATFASSTTDSRPGDLFALLTDGLVEVFDAEGHELGFDWAKDLLRDAGAAPLTAVADRLLAGAREHGAQLDDQTLLLIRRR
jgi:sigma-B regulation protein RsbU (phosphoserine phosphatase)